MDADDLDLATAPSPLDPGGPMMGAMRRGYFGFSPTETWTPNVNLYEDDTRYLVCVDLAGVDKGTIDLTVADGRLKLKGRRAVPAFPEGQTDPHPVSGPDDAAEGDGPKKPRRRPSKVPESRGRVRMHLMEIDHGGFGREVELPEDVRQADINAAYRNGMLWIEIPKR